jgi:C-terminal processing protease CtpA/Prc
MKIHYFFQFFSWVIFVSPEPGAQINADPDPPQACLQVDIEEGGVNGLVVRSLTRGGTLARDGRIQPGDYLVNVNGENLRSVSQAAALAVLRRTQLVPQGEFSIEHQHKE